MGTELKEWARNYLKYKDIIKKEIIKIEEAEDGLTIEKRNKKEKWIVDEKLKIKDAKGIICLNNKENLKELIENWDSLKDNKELKIIFATPEKNEKWEIIPHIHNKITERKKLRQGLNTLMSSIPESPAKKSTRQEIGSQ